MTLGGQAGPWWKAALRSALGAMGVLSLAALCVAFGWWPAAAILALGVCVFVLVLVRNPKWWYRRMAGVSLAGAVVAVMVPRVLIAVDAAAFGTLVVFIDGPAGWVLPLALLGVAVVFGVLAWRSDRPAGRGGGPRARATVIGAGNAVATSGSNSPASVVGNITYGLDAKELADRLVEEATRAGMFEERCGYLERENAKLKEQLAAGLERVGGEAAAGDVSASIAVEEARRSGDLSKLQAVLIREADAAAAQVDVSLQPYLAVCREIAAVAYVRGDIDEVERRLDIVLQANPSDRVSLHQRGHVHHLRGRLNDARHAFRRLLKVANNDTDRAIAYSSLGSVERTGGNLREAVEHVEQALTIYQREGQQGLVANQYGILGLIELPRGELDAAEQHLRLALESHQALGWSIELAADLGNLGLIERVRGNLDAAESFHRSALAIHESMGRLAGVSIDLGNLAQIEWTRGNLEAAAGFLKRALEIDKGLGRVEGVANHYATLSMVALTRGAIDEARRHAKEAIRINEQIGRVDAVAADYGNLGLIERTIGNLDEAEAHHRKALAINEQIGAIIGVASQLGALGLVELARGRLDTAQRLMERALDIETRIGRKEGIAIQYGNLGTIELRRGRWDAAEAAITKSLAINEKLGRAEGVAIDNANMGLLEASRGNQQRAKEHMEVAAELNERIGRVEAAANQYSNLGALARGVNEHRAARRWWEAAVALYRKCGSTRMMDRVQAWLDELPPE